MTQINEGTVPTLIHDIYGEGVLVYFLPGDTISPRNAEVGIRSAQLGMSVENYLEMIRMHTAEGKEVTK